MRVKEDQEIPTSFAAPSNPGSHSHPGISWLAAVVLVICDVLAPRGGLGRVFTVLEHCDVFHKAAGGGGVPVLLAGRGVERLAGTDFNNLSVPGTETAYTLGDAQVLAVFVGVPGGARSGREADGGDDHRLVGLVGQREIGRASCRERVL